MASEGKGLLADVVRNFFEAQGNSLLTNGFCQIASHFDEQLVLEKNRNLKEVEEEGKKKLEAQLATLTKREQDLNKKTGDLRLETEKVEGMQKQLKVDLEDVAAKKKWCEKQVKDLEIRSDAIGSHEKELEKKMAARELRLAAREKELEDRMAEKTEALGKWEEVLKVRELDFDFEMMSVKPEKKKEGREVWIPLETFVKNETGDSAEKSPSEVKNFQKVAGMLGKRGMEVYVKLLDFEGAMVGVKSPGASDISTVAKGSGQDMKECLRNTCEKLIRVIKSNNQAAVGRLSVVSTPAHD